MPTGVASRTANEFLGLAAPQQNCGHKTQAKGRSHGHEPPIGELRGYTLRHLLSGREDAIGDAFLRHGLRCNEPTEVSLLLLPGARGIGIRISDPFADGRCGLFRRVRLPTASSAIASRSDSFCIVISIRRAQSSNGHRRLKGPNLAPYGGSGAPLATQR